MLQTIYEVSVYHNDYFDHFRNGSDKPHVERFTNFIEAFKAYKESKSKDYCWPGDHERTTVWNKIVEFVKPVQPKHGLVVGYMPAKTDHRAPCCLDYLDDSEDVVDLPLDRDFSDCQCAFFDDEIIEF